MGCTRRRLTCFRACQRSWASCIANQLSGVRPSAFDNRRAISGVTRLVPFRTRLSVDAATSKLCASSRPLTPLGSKYTSKMNSPGCGGLCMDFNSLTSSARLKSWDSRAWRSPGRLAPGGGWLAIPARPEFYRAAPLVVSLAPSPGVCAEPSLVPGCRVR